jgi:branched-chain amino acid transport system permease protein
MSVTSARRVLGGQSAAIGGRALTIALFVVVAYSVSHGTLYEQSLVSTAAVFAILALSLDLVAGVTGLYSLGHAGLFALGAYGTALLNTHRGWNVFVLLPVVMAGTGLVGLVLGALSLRVSGLYFAITTFVFTLVVGVLASDLKLTGGLQGIEGPIFPEFPLSRAGMGSALTWCVMAALALTVYIVWAIRRSALYPVLLAIRDAEPFAAAAGVRTKVMKVALFGLSAALAGMAGWCFSFLGFISPGQFAWTVSVNILVMVILGGINTTAGPIIGAVFVSVFPAYVHFSPLWQEVLFGLLFVVVIIFFPQGFMGLVAAGVRRLGRDRTLPSAVPVPPRDLHAVAEALAAQPDTEPSEENAVECRGIVFGYVQGIRALNGVDLSVRRGTIHGLIGPNGSGKSTLASLIAGHERPDAGTITVNGARVERLGAAARPHHGLTRTFQSAVLVKELPARANVAVGSYSRVPRIGLRALVWPLLPTAYRDGRRLRERSDDALSLVGIPSWSGTRIADVPHGIEQLTQLAAACVSGPSVLLLDEPLAGLSPGEVDHVAEILRDLRRTGITVIVIEHQTRFIFDVCDDVTVLSAGEPVAAGPAAEVREHTRVREVYLGK